MCRLNHSVSLHDIAIYWPGMDNTVFLVIFTDIREHFDNIVLMHQTFHKCKGKYSILSTHINDVLKTEKLSLRKETLCTHAHS